MTSAAEHYDKAEQALADALDARDRHAEALEALALSYVQAHALLALARARLDEEQR